MSVPYYHLMVTQAVLSFSDAPASPSASVWFPRTIFARLGWPSDILRDAGTNFLAGTMESLWEAHGVNHLVATPYHHQTNGLVEKFNGTLGAMIRKFVNSDGEIHFCVDYRKLNAVIHPDNYPMPRTDELLEKLGQAQFISTLDLTKGYWQVLLDESTKERSAFITHVGLYEFNVLPFGLQNAPTTFQRLVDGLLAELGEYAVAYLDDVAIFLDSWAEHLEHLQKVFKRIREAGLTVKAKKCQIGLNRVTFLGHQVGQGTINPLQAKVDAIQKWPVPKSKK
ncbi:unnamed protein product [Eretmochelys imbricata]